jgi:small subunit ribosomal protein S1
VHISELAQHHVENPREVVSQGDVVNAKIIEVDAERRRLSLSLKRVEGGGVTERAEDAEAVEGTPNLDLSEEVFPESSAAPEADPLPEAEPETEQEPELEPAAEEAAEEPVAEAAPEPEAAVESEPVAEEAEPEPAAEPEAEAPADQPE